MNVFVCVGWALHLRRWAKIGPLCHNGFLVCVCVFLNTKRVVPPPRFALIHLEKPSVDVFYESLSLAAMSGRPICQCRLVPSIQPRRNHQQVPFFPSWPAPKRRANTCWCSAGNEGMTPTNHPLWFPLKGPPSSFPTPGRSFPTEHQQEEAGTCRRST